VITIVGTGNVGSAAAFDILKARISDVVIIDLRGIGERQSIGHDAGCARHRI
jgi:malate/lactate dehydrogenase